VPPRKKPATRAVKKTVSQKPALAAVPSWQLAASAADSKKATAIRVLDLRPVTSFADFFVICNGANQRQIQTISDDVERVLKAHGERPNSIEGYANAEWILMDYGDLVVHIFSEQSRVYYDLDRLWRDATPVEFTTSV
jgi:ribosome-associated protein